MSFSMIYYFMIDSMKIDLILQKFHHFRLNHPYQSLWEVSSSLIGVSYLCCHCTMFLEINFLCLFFYFSLTSNLPLAPFSKFPFHLFFSLFFSLTVSVIWAYLKTVGGFIHLSNYSLSALSSSFRAYILLFFNRRLIQAAFLSPCHEYFASIELLISEERT